MGPSGALGVLLRLAPLGVGTAPCLVLRPPVGDLGGVGAEGGHRRLA
jgi:hypothetical protein